ncbi:MAG: Zn-dependent hydrolase, partial [Defluviitaleaceae bacterium]|nr:Zn-dependent hydrolase [Defluviitaleaceae bacterium]
MMNLETSAERIKADIEVVSNCTATPGKGATRLPFTPDAREAAEHIKQMMEDVGLSNIHEDAIGNVVGVLEGENPHEKAIMIGSHYDTVINGGNFDGFAGIAAAFEVCRFLRDNNIKLRRNLVVTAFNGEEGIRFCGYLGSQAMAGQINLDNLHSLKDADGITAYDAMKAYGLTPEKIDEAMRTLDNVGTFIEMHIEQGAVLYERGIDIGLVECIVGMERYMITVRGRADHAGTTPMDMRLDSVEAAARVIAKIPGFARETGNAVATVGIVKVTPCAANVVAKEVQFSIDVRSSDKTRIDEITDKIFAELEETSAATGTSYETDKQISIEPLQLCEPIIGAMQEICESRGYSGLRMN